METGYSPPGHPCAHALMHPCDGHYAAATGSRFFTIAAPETVLLQTGQCQSSIGGDFPSRWTLWNLARSCLQTCLGAIACSFLPAGSDRPASQFTTPGPDALGESAPSRCPSGEVLPSHLVCRVPRVPRPIRDAGPHIVPAAEPLSRFGGRKVAILAACVEPPSRTRRILDLPVQARDRGGHRMRRAPTLCGRNDARTPQTRS